MQNNELTAHVAKTVARLYICHLFWKMFHNKMKEIPFEVSTFFMSATAPVILTDELKASLCRPARSTLSNHVQLAFIYQTA